MKKRILSIVLSIVMLVSLLPTTAWATETENPHPTDSEHGEGWTAWDGTDRDNKTPGDQLTAGSYYLTGDVDVDVTIVGEVNLCLNGHTITTNDSYGAFDVESGATLNICDCSTNQSGKIENTNATTYYPGIRNNGGTVNVYGGTVSGAHTGIININNSGGAVNVYGGTVSGTNTGIRNEQNNNLNIYNGTAQATGSTGYGVYNQGTVSVSGGIVTGGSNGIHNYYTGTINVSGTADIIGITGIYNDGGTFTVSGGTVTATGSSGSGIYNSGTGTLTVSGGTVTANHGSSKGISNSGTLNLQGAPSITGAAADIYLSKDKLITITGKLTYIGNDISVQMAATDGGTFTTGWTDKMGDADPDDYFTSANSGYTVQLDTSGELKLAEPPAAETHSHDMSVECGDGDPVTFVAWDGTGTFPTTGGNVYLTKDVTLTNTITISSGEVNLCLNGNDITASGVDAIKVTKGATLNLCDCKDSGTISGNTGIYNKGGTVNVYNGTVSGTDEYSYGIDNSNDSYTENPSVVTVYGGTVNGDIDNYYYDSTLNICGGTVNGNINNQNGAAINITGGTVNGDIYNQTMASITVESGVVNGVISNSYETFLTVKGGTIDAILSDHKIEKGSFTLSGAPTIKGKWSEEWVEFYGVSGGIFLTADPIVIGEGGLSNTTPYTVATNKEPTESAPIKIVAENDTDYSAKFAPADTSSYRVVRGDDKCLYLAVKPATIPVTSVTLSNTSLTLDVNGTENLTATVSPDDATDKTVSWTSDNTGVATVGQNGVVTAVAPGTATITATANDGSGVTSSCAVKVNKFIPTAADFTFTAPNNLTYDGYEKAATVVGKDGMGAVTVEYYKDDAPINSPKDAGEYTVKINVAESTYYKAVEGLVVGTFNIAAKSMTNFNVEGVAASYTYTGSEIKPVPIVKDGETPLTVGTDYEVSYTGNTAVGTATVTITGIGNYTGTKTVTFSIVYATKDASEVFTWTTGEHGWFNAEYAPVFTPAEGYEVSTEANGNYSTSAPDFDNAGQGEVTRTVYVKEIETGTIYQVTLTYNYDKSYPEVTAEEVDNTWSNVSKEIMVTATDGISGIASVEISDQSGIPQAVELVDGRYFCTVTEIGTYAVTVTDNAGNVSRRVVYVKHIDKYGPGLMIYGYNYDGGWHTTAPTVTVEGHDNESGIPTEGAYSFDGGKTWQDVGTKEYCDGEHTVTIWVKDNVGNIQQCDPFTVKVDTVAPGDVTVTATAGEDGYASGEWTTGDIAFTLSASDATSGIQKYQVKIGDGEWVDVDGNTHTHTASTDENGVSYQFRAVDKAGNVGEASESITVKKRQPYTIRFDANGGTGDMTVQIAYIGTALNLTENAFTREGYKFMGWAESADATGVDYVDKQSVSNLTAEANGEVTLYAVWTRDIILSGSITADGVPADQLSVTMRGLDGTEYPVSVTGDASPYHYTVTVPEGEYQLVIKDTKNNVTVTAKEELTGDKTEEPITMPIGNKSSIVDSENAGEYAPIVGGLDAIAENTEGTNVTVTLTMTHEPADEEDSERDALMDAAGSQKGKLTFFEIDLVKNVEGTETPITETSVPIEIIIPFDTTRKQNFKVYRFHDYNGNDIVDEGEVDILTTTANADGEYIEVGTGSVTIHAKFFSLYAIGYTDVIPVHGCTSKCPVCGGCKDADCTESACKEKCRLFGMNFSDVADGKWYTEPVEYVYHHKMMEGVGNNLFDINGTATRAMVVTILWRLEGEPVVNYLMQFEDVPAENWCTEAVRWAASEKIVEGYSNTAFAPTEPITREQFATILWRYAKYKGYDVSVGEDTNILSYEDAFSTSEYAIPALQWACGAGLMQGDGVNLMPKADATRAQAAALFQRFCENVEEK